MFCTSNIVLMIHTQTTNENLLTLQIMPETNYMALNKVNKQIATTRTHNKLLHLLYVFEGVEGD